MDELEDLTVILGINLHYAGDWIQFLMDNNLSAEHSPNTIGSNTIGSLSPSTDAAILTLASMLKRPIDPMANYYALQSACDNGWLLPTDKVRELIGIAPRGEECDRLGFRFTRSTKRRTEWSVSRQPID